MTKVSMLEAKANLSELIDALESGAESEIVISRDGKPAARLVAVEEPVRRPIRLGLADGKYPTFTWEEWKQGDAEMLKMFEEAAARKEELWARWEREAAEDDDASAS